MWVIFSLCRELDGHLGSLGADLGITLGCSRGPGIDFRWIWGFQMVPIGVPNPVNLAHFFDMVAQQCLCIVDTRF